jgi:hypothetical protein
MEILLAHPTLPEQGTVEINISRTFVINVPAEEARRQVNRWLFTEVSCMMGAEAPQLVIGERVVWRVPAVLTASHIGRVGLVGTVDVDVQTGFMDNSAQRVKELQERGIALGQQMPPYQPRSVVAAEYLAKNVFPTHSASVPHLTSNLA